MTRPEIIRALQAADILYDYEARFGTMCITVRTADIRDFAQFDVIRNLHGWRGGSIPHGDYLDFVFVPDRAPQPTSVPKPRSSVSGHAARGRSHGRR